MSIIKETVRGLEEMEYMKTLYFFQLFCKPKTA